MSRWMLLLLVVAAVAIAAAAHWQFAERGPVREAVAATQWAVVIWSAGAALAACVAVAVFTAVTARGAVGWRYRVLNPAANLAAAGTFVAAAGWVAYMLLVSVPAAKLELLVADLLKEKEPLANARPFADRVSQRTVYPDLAFLHALNNCGADLEYDGERIMKGAADPYEHKPLADDAAARVGWGTVVARLTPKDLPGYREIFIIHGDLRDHQDRQNVKKALETRRQQLLTLAATNSAHKFLGEAHARFDDLVSRVQIQEPMPEAIDSLSKLARKLAGRTRSELVASRQTEYEMDWDGYIGAIKGAVNAIEKPKHAEEVIRALYTGIEELEKYVNQSKKAPSPWWAKWKKKVVTFPDSLPKGPVESLTKLGDQGRNQREEVEKLLVKFKEYINEVVKAGDEEAVQPARIPPTGQHPGGWTPAGVEALVKDKWGLQKWANVKYEAKDHHSVLRVIEGAWAELWVRVTPQNTPMLDDAVRAAQAEAMKKIKLFLRRYSKDLRDRIARVKGANYQKHGEFGEPFAVNERFKDDNKRKWLKETLTELKYKYETVDLKPTPPTNKELVRCTVEASQMAEKAAEVFDRVCGEDSKPGDEDWRHAALWWLIFFGSEGKEPGFHPFEEADRSRKSIKLAGPDGKEMDIGGLASTDDASLQAYGQPKPATVTTTPPPPDKPPR